MPRVNDERTGPATCERRRFSSAIVPPWARKTPKITEVLPLLYLPGLLSGDSVPALGQFLGLVSARRPGPSPRTPASGRRPGGGESHYAAGRNGASTTK